jgi:hypothetical protein
MLPSLMSLAPLGLRLGLIVVYTDSSASLCAIRARESLPSGSMLARLRVAETIIVSSLDEDAYDAP